MFKKSVLSCITLLITASCLMFTGCNATPTTTELLTTVDKQFSDSNTFSGNMNILLGYKEENASVQNIFDAYFTSDIESKQIRMTGDFKTTMIDKNGKISEEVTKADQYINKYYTYDYLSEDEKWMSYKNEDPDFTYLTETNYSEIADKFVIDETFNEEVSGVEAYKLTSTEPMKISEFINHTQPLFAINSFVAADCLDVEGTVELYISKESGQLLKQDLSFDTKIKENDFTVNFVLYYNELNMDLEIEIPEGIEAENKNEYLED